MSAARVWPLMAALLILAACAVRPAVSETLPGAKIAAETRAVLESGDWLVARGIHVADNIVSTVTNKPLSHAALYDAKTDEVIEADGSGVHVTPLAAFMANSTRVLVIRPLWATPQTRPQAVARARSWLGRGYNFTGLIGLSMPDRYYCTQLAVKAYAPFIDRKERKQNPIPHIIEPGQMYHWGRIVYDSGP